MYKWEEYEDLKDEVLDFMGNYFNNNYPNIWEFPPFTGRGSIIQLKNNKFINFEFLQLINPDTKCIELALFFIVNKIKYAIVRKTGLKPDEITFNDTYKINLQTLFSAIINENERNLLYLNKISNRHVNELKIIKIGEIQK